MNREFRGVGLADLEKELDYQDTLPPKDASGRNSRTYGGLFEFYQSVTRRLKEHYIMLLEIVGIAGEEHHVQLNNPEEKA